MGDIIAEPREAFAWLSDECWIAFAYEAGFAQYLEDCYFTPGTPKNDEFEVLAVPLGGKVLPGIAAFFRLRDNAENRDSLRAALADYYGERLSTLAELDGVIETQRRRIRETVNQRFR